MREYWWDLPHHEKHEQIVTDVEALQNGDQNQRMMSWSSCLAQYLDRPLADDVDIARWRSQALYGGAKQLHLNVSKSALDAVSAKIAPHRTKPMFLTVAGKWRDRQRAKLLERWSEGFLHREKFYVHTAPHVFMDGGIFGTGAVKFVEDDEEDDFHLEWVWPGELWFDEIGAAYADPRCMFQVRHMHRHQLLAKFPEAEAVIESAASVTADEASVTTDDIIPVIEAWHLPSCKGADDGYHVICIDGQTLRERPWRMDCFPFVFWRWGVSPIGFWGTGLMEDLRGIQEEINKLLKRIQESMNVNATSVVMLPKGCGVEPSDLSNMPGQIVPYAGQIPPQYVTPPSMANDVFGHLWRLRDAAYEVAGISQLSAASVKPPGVESGIAIEYLQDAETQRFALTADRWQEFTLEVVERAVEFARHVYGKKSKKVKWGEGTVVDEIDWKDVDLAREAYVLRAYPVNFLPSHPVGKMQRIEKLATIQAGGQSIFSPSEIKSLLDFPDLRKTMDLETAAYEDSVMICDKMLYEGESIIPQAEMNLELCIKMAQHYWLLGHREGAPEENMDLLVDFIHQARHQQKRKLADAMPPGGVVPPGPMGPGPVDLPPGAAGLPPPPGMGAGVPMPGNLPVPGDTPL